MPFGDEYPLDPVDTEEEPGYGEPWEGRDLELNDIYYLGEELEADTIRNLVAEQVETWRRVPNLVVEAKGRKGYTAEDSAALRGYWQVSPQDGSWSKGNPPRIYVDCASGELVSAFFINTPPLPRDDVQEEVMGLLTANGDRMAQDKIVEELSPGYDTETVEDAIADLYRDGLKGAATDGEIIVPRPDPSPAPDHLVERMAADHPGQLDAEKAVEQLEEQASKPSSTIYEEEEREEWREDVRDWLDLGPVFTRD